MEGQERQELIKDGAQGVQERPERLWDGGKILRGYESAVALSEHGEDSFASAGA